MAEIFSHEETCVDPSMLFENTRQRVAWKLKLRYRDREWNTLATIPSVFTPYLLWSK